MFPFLSSRGVLGLNARNLLYVKAFNPRKAVAFADDKLKTKAFLAARGIPTPKLYARIDDRAQLRSFDFSSLPDRCVLKPNSGFGGGGIIICNGRKDGQFLEQGKHPISDRALFEHIEDILDGKYAINGVQDRAFFEKMLIADSVFAPLRPAGLPDIRIIVFNLVPVMAMVRIPTVASSGKANVHMGGIGIGIDIAKGVTTFATQFNRRIERLPHGASPEGFEIPHWDEMLLTASRIQYLTNIGYLAVDLTVDEEQGVVLLEVNARAGLMVQVANLSPLRSHLERVQGLSVLSPEKGVLLAKELFGSSTRHRSELPVASDSVLGTRETIAIVSPHSTIEVPAMISLDRERSVFSPNLVAELRAAGAIEQELEDDSFRVKFTLKGSKVQTVVRQDAVVPFPMRAIIGRRDLAGFLIDPSREEPAISVRLSKKEDVRSIDRVLAQVDERFPLLPHIRPLNLEEEKERAKNDPHYNPTFQYAVSDHTFEEVEERLVALLPDESPIGLLLKKKRRELLQRLTLMRARGEARRFTEASAALFGAPSSVLLMTAESVMQEYGARTTAASSPLLSSEQCVEYFTKTLAHYGLHDWQVVVGDRIIARCAVGERKIYLRKDALFSQIEMDSLIAHEIETHALTAENGAHQPYLLLRRGCANYLDTQEGLAVYCQNRVLPPDHEKRFGPARNLLGIAYALEHSFAETRDYLEHALGYDAEKALNKAIDMKRGLADAGEPGAFTKGIVYLRGLRAIEQFIAQGGDLRRLFIGKIALEDLELIERIPNLRPPILLPQFLQEQPTKDRKRKKKR